MEKPVDNFVLLACAEFWLRGLSCWSRYDSCSLEERRWQDTMSQVLLRQAGLVQSHQDPRVPEAQKEKSAARG